MIKHTLRYFILSLCFMTGLVFASTFNPTQTKAVQQIVKSYILSHPQIILQAYQKLQSEEAEHAQETFNSVVHKHAALIFNDKNSPTVNAAQYTVSIVEFYDYQCSHCKQMNPFIQSLIKNHPNIRYIFKEFPIFGDNSIFAAKAALAANQLGKFLPLDNALLSHQGKLTHQITLNIAQSVGIDMSTLKKVMASKRVMNELANNLFLARSLRLEGTPAFIIANRSLTKMLLIPGAAPEHTFMRAIRAVQNP